MPLTKRLVPFVLVCGVAGGLIAWLFISGDSPQSTTPFAADGLRLLAYTEGGNVAWEIRAKQGDVHDAKSSLQDVEIDFRNAQEGALTAAAGRLVRSEGSARLSEGVVIEREDGLRLETDDLTWNESAELLDAGSIDLVTGSLSIHAGEFRYDLGRETTSLSGGVRFVDESDRGFVATAEHAEESGGRFVLEGNVEATLEEGTLRAQTLEITDGGLTAIGEVRVRFDLSGMSAVRPAEEQIDGADPLRRLNGA